jgi:hypothetical protein
MAEGVKSQDIVIYSLKDGQISFNVNVFEETVWLTQKQMAELFDKDRKTITRHIANIFKEGELNKKSVCSYFEHTANDGKKYKTQYYNLDVIISVGYRVKSKRGVQFRIWATKILKQYLVSGYSLNEKRIKAILEEYVKEVKSEYKKDLRKIYKKIAEISNKPINIYNQVSLTNNKQLEEKIITLIDQLIIQIKSETKNKKIEAELEEVKNIIKSPKKSDKERNKVINFFNKLGDDKSDLSKTIKGLGVASKIVRELLKLGQKIKELIW